MKKRRTLAELFVDKLEDLSDGKANLISNKALREALKWDEPKYKRIRSELWFQGKIIRGRGYGGSVGLARGGGVEALDVFVSYSHADEQAKNDLLKHLEPLRRLEIIKAWHDRMLKPGEDWGKKISDNLEKADIILLLVSIDFINSPYCYDIELDRAIERHTNGESVVIPVILRSCMWKSTPFGTIQAVPRDGRPVNLWNDRDEAFMNIAEGIKQMAEELLNSR
jgi:TIR domain